MWLRAAIVVVFVCGSRDVLAQQPASRTEALESARRQKQAMLWPERQDPLVARANGLLDRGFGEGLRTGTGANGWQLLFAGTRPAQGQAFGIGYRRSDHLHDVLTVRAGIRGTLAGAFVVDGEAELPKTFRPTTTPEYGDYFGAVLQVVREGHPGGTLVLVWRRVDAEWRLVAYRAIE
jgi:hypothetical protein